MVGGVACSSSSRGPANSSGVSVKASDTACVAASTMFMSGTQTFAVSNVGSQVTEFLVYAPGDRVVGEVGNIGPSAGKRLTVALKAGEYDLACRPGRSGKGIRTPIVVKAPSGEQPTTSPELDAAVATYRSYVVAQARAAGRPGRSRSSLRSSGRSAEGHGALSQRAGAVRRDRAGGRVVRRSRRAHRRPHRRCRGRPAMDRLSSPRARPLDDQRHQPGRPGCPAIAGRYRQAGGSGPAHRPQRRSDRDGRGEHAQAGRQP